MSKKTILILLIAFGSSYSFAASGSLKGEQVSGLNKICYYNGPSGSFTKTVGSYNVCPQTANDGKKSTSSSTRRSGDQSNSTVGRLSGEQVSGLNKTCYYKSPRGAFTKTVGSYATCPQSARHTY